MRDLSIIVAFSRDHSIIVVPILKSFQWQFGTFTVQKTSAQGRSRKNLVLREDLEKIDQILTFFYVRCLGQV